MADEQAAVETTRRELLKRAAYVAPAVLSLVALPSFASAGSGSGETDGRQLHLRSGRFGQRNPDGGNESLPHR